MNGGTGEIARTLYVGEMDNNNNNKIDNSPDKHFEHSSLMPILLYDG